MSYKPTIALFGAHGLLAKPIIAALTSPLFVNRFSFPIHVITRDASKEKNTAEVKYYSAPNSSVEELDAALKGVDVFVNISSPGLHSSNLIKSAANNKIKLYFPSEFGTNYDECDWPTVFDGKRSHYEAARAAGLKTVLVRNGLFAEFLLGPSSYYFSSGKYELIGTEGYPVSVTSLADVGRVVASLASKDPSTIPSKIKINSAQLPIKHFINLYEKQTGKKLEITVITLEEQIKKTNELVKKGVTSMEELIVVINTIMGQGPGKGSSYGKDVQNDFVNDGEWKWDEFN